MLVLSRIVGEHIVIDPQQCPLNEQGLIDIAIVGVAGNKVKVGVDANPQIKVDRKEIYDRKQRDGGHWPGDRAA